MTRDELPRRFRNIICCVDGTCHLPQAKWHGTPGGYSNHACRCRECTDAWAQWHYHSGVQERYARTLIENGLTVQGTPRKRRYAPKAAGPPGTRPRRPTLKEDA